jgi:hypothetical protein
VPNTTTHGAAGNERDRGAGLAGKYVGDAGIENDLAVVFTENFEEGSLGAGWKRWESFHPDPNGMPFEGFQWRSTPELRLNFLWLLLYITDAPSGHISRVWFDNIVVAREYIGPVHVAGAR